MLPPGDSQVAFSVRRATADDAPGILACMRAAFAPYQNSYTPEAYADTILTPETLHTRSQAMTIFVAVNDLEEVIGTIACNVAHKGEGHVRGMAVTPNRQEARVADQLLHSAELELRARGCQRVTLDTTAPLQRAVAFYKRNGYRSTGRMSDFFGMPLFEYTKSL